MTRRGRNELGEFLQARRALLTPDDVGLPRSGRRRVAGLRREEVAALGGLSVPYLARLEQGRDRNPSPQVVETLGAALRLDGAGFAHLRRLAAPGPPAEAPPQPPGWVRPGVRHLLEAWTGQAAFVIDRFGTVRAANALAVALYPGFVPETNILRYVFLDPDARTYDPDHELVAPRIVADIRATSAAAPDDAGFAALITELKDRSPEFARLWARHDAHEKTLGVKRFVHPRVGLISLSFECFVVSGSPELTLFVLFAEPGSAAQQKLDRLASRSGPLMNYQDAWQPVRNDGAAGDVLVGECEQPARTNPGGASP